MGHETARQMIGSEVICCLADPVTVTVCWDALTRVTAFAPKAAATTRASPIRTAESRGRYARASGMSARALLQLIASR